MDVMRFVLFNCVFRFLGKAHMLLRLLHRDNFHLFINKTADFLIELVSKCLYLFLQHSKLIFAWIAATVLFFEYHQLFYFRNWKLDGAVFGNSQKIVNKLDRNWLARLIKLNDSVWKGWRIIGFLWFLVIHKWDADL